MYIYIAVLLLGVDIKSEKNILIKKIQRKRKKLKLQIWTMKRKMYLLDLLETAEMLDT